MERAPGLSDETCRSYGAEPDSVGGVFYKHDAPTELPHIRAIWSIQVTEFLLYGPTQNSG
jgi:hypothetical protein